MLDALFKTALKRARSRADSRFDREGSRLHRALNAGMVIAVVIIGVVALVGILVFAQVEEALPSDGLEDDEGNANELGESASAVTDGFGGAMELVPVILIVALATVVIGYVQRMR